MLPWLDRRVRPLPLSAHPPTSLHRRAARRDDVRPRLRGSIGGYAATMVRYTTELVDQWQDGQIRDVHQDMVRLTAQIAVRSLFGAEVGHADGDAIRDALAEMARLEEIEYTGLPGLLPYWMPTPHRRRLRRASAHVERLFMRAVDRRRRPPAASGVPGGPPDLLAMLLGARDEAGRPMAERQLRDEIHTLYVAGHATTANTLGFAFALLARHPDVLDRLHAELDEVLGDADPDFEDVTRLPFTEACVKETLRLFPVVAMLPRKANVALELRGRTIPPDAGIWVSAWVTHRDPRFWPEPTRFRPARWLDEDARTHRSAWFPPSTAPPGPSGPRFSTGSACSTPPPPPASPRHATNSPWPKASPTPSTTSSTTTATG